VLDLKSLAKLEFLLTDQNVNCLDLNMVQFDRITDIHRKGFVSLIRSSGVRTLNLEGLEQPTAQGLFDEQFIIDISETQLERLYSDALPKTVYVS
ncbi:hypothetical protein PMAYCL1PPCAC_19233, partial [Pristionchus mayeri]